MEVQTSTYTPFDKGTCDAVLNMLKDMKDAGDEWEITFSTANGEKDTRENIEFDVKKLCNPRTHPYVMDDSPDVLSIGSRCN